MALAWRTELERGNLITASAHEVYVKAASPILPTADPFNRLMRLADDDMASLARQFKLNPNPLMWSEKFIRILMEYHARAYMLGGAESRTVADAFAQQVMYIGKGQASEAEADYVLGFLNDLLDRDGRYFTDDGVNDDELLRRMRMYQGKMRGSQGWGFVESRPPNREFNWVLGAVEDHCDQCPFLASLSPWPITNIYTAPGSGETPCLFNCKCWWEDSLTGETSALPIERGND